jgi:ketosteroid isomerase-like protein
LGGTINEGGAPLKFSDADREAIRLAGEVFAKTADVEPRDVRAAAACYEDDAIMLAPSQSPIVGRIAIEAFLSCFPPFSDYRLEVAEIEGDGDLAYERGGASMIMAPPNAGPTQWRIQYVIVWRRQLDGSWNAAREIFTPAAAPAV